MDGQKSLNSNYTNITIEEIADELINYDYFSEKYDEVEGLDSYLEKELPTSFVKVFEDENKDFTWVVQRLIK